MSRLILCAVCGQKANQRKYGGPCTVCGMPLCPKQGRVRPVNQRFVRYNESGPKPSVISIRRGLTPQIGTSDWRADMDSTRECSVEGCPRAVARRGMCQTHYNQVRSGLPVTAVRRYVTGTTQERLDAYTERTKTCWLWIGSKNTHGYGQITVGGRCRHAFRIAYELRYGPVAKGHEVDHICRVRACVNPDHLQEVTKKENAENRGPNRTNTSGARGVSWCARTRKWRVRVTHFGRSVWGGRYAELDDAADAAVRIRNSLHTNNYADESNAAITASARPTCLEHAA